MNDMHTTFTPAFGCEIELWALELEHFYQCVSSKTPGVVYRHPSWLIHSEQIIITMQYLNGSTIIGFHIRPQVSYHKVSRSPSLILTMDMSNTLFLSFDIHLVPI